ncbi:MAG TPA: cytochrome c oxidase subunit 3 [Sphingomonas sp.]|nr:cytochrome c oxidase subunit 3 [Sphingomonas sp.]
MSSAPAPTLEEPFRIPERQHESMVFGLWVFLSTEVLFFGGLFLFYAYFRHFYPAGFFAGARQANPIYGTANTAVLLTSSLTIAMGERAVRARWFRLARWGLSLTVALGLTFIIVKLFEYRSDLREHLLPGHGFSVTGIGAEQFWDFYWVITVIHAIHLSVGIGLVVRLLFLVRGHQLGKRWMTTEVTTIYWHLVDIVWVILYPLIYLVGRGI